MKNTHIILLVKIITYFIKTYFCIVFIAQTFILIKNLRFMVSIYIVLSFINYRLFVFVIIYYFNQFTSW